MTAAEMRAKARDRLNAETPPGWGQKYVPGPWSEEERRRRTCRCCRTDTSDRWTVTLMVHRSETKEVVYFTFAMLCAGCLNDESKLEELKRRVFAEYDR